MFQEILVLTGWHELGALILRPVVVSDTHFIYHETISEVNSTIDRKKQETHYYEGSTTELRTCICQRGVATKGDDRCSVTIGTKRSDDRSPVPLERVGKHHNNGDALRRKLACPIPWF